MESNTNENSKGRRGLISIIGLVIMLLGMIASVQADGSIIPDLVLFAGGIMILVAEKAMVNEGGHQ